MHFAAVDFVKVSYVPLPPVELRQQPRGEISVHEVGVGGWVGLDPDLAERCEPDRAVPDLAARCLVRRIRSSSACSTNSFWLLASAMYSMSTVGTEARQQHSTSKVSIEKEGDDMVSTKSEGIAEHVPQC